MPVIGGVPNFSGVTAGVSSINSIAGAASITSPDASITVTPNGQNIELEAAGGGGTPGSPDLSIQGNSGGDFVGIPGSAFDATSGALTLTAASTSTPLTILGDDLNNPPLNVVSFSGGASNFSAQDTDGANTFDVAIFNGTETDGTGAAITNITTQMIGSLQGTNVGGDSVVLIQTIMSNTASGGSPEELTDIKISGGTQSAASIPVSITGITIGDKNSGSHPASGVNAAILIQNQTAGANVYAIKTGTGPVDFGGTVNSVGGYKAGGVAGISGTGTTMSNVTVVNGIITAATFT